MGITAETLALIVLAQNYAGDIVRQANRTSMALRTLPIVTGEGKNVAWAAESTGVTAEEYSETTTDVSNASSDAQDPATLSWAMMRANFSVTGMARAAARTSGTPAGNVGLWGRNLVNACTGLTSLINQRIFSGNGAASPKQITGLDSAIGDDTNTYATIVRTGSRTWWIPVRRRSCRSRRSARTSSRST
jgi:hypothetical protein